MSNDLSLNLSLKFLGKMVNVIIDRPLNSKHPKHNFIYKLNYGYIPNTLALDDEEIDAYVLGVNEPIKSFYGKCIAIIHRLNDIEDKLIVVSENKDFSDEEIKKLIDFQEKYFEYIIVR